MQRTGGSSCCARAASSAAAGPSPRCQPAFPTRRCIVPVVRCKPPPAVESSEEDRSVVHPEPSSLAPNSQFLSALQQSRLAWQQALEKRGEADRRVLLRGTLLLIGVALGFTPGSPAKAGVADNDARLRAIQAPPPVVGWGAPMSKELVKEQDDPMMFAYPWASDLPLNLKVREYNNIIRKLRPSCWQAIAQQISSSKYSALSVSLTSAPFADIRQAALMLPWALLQRDEYTAAVDARKAYNGFNAHVMDLQTVSLAAAAGDAKPEQVQQAFILMSASLDQLLATIPVRWTAEGPVRGGEK